jgi:hypothetical protein
MCIEEVTLTIKKLPSSALSASGSQGIISASFREHPCFEGKVSSNYFNLQAFCEKARMAVMK